MVLRGEQLSADFATNYIQFGGRWAIPMRAAIEPFFSASLGMAIFEPPGDIDGSTRFSWSLGGGFRKMFSPKMGIRTDITMVGDAGPLGRILAVVWLLRLLRGRRHGVDFPGSGQRRAGHSVLRSLSL